MAKASTPSRGAGSSARRDPQREALPPKRRWWRVAKWGGALAFVGAVVAATTVALVLWMYGRDPNLPAIDKLSDYHPKQVTQILDANDRRIGELGTMRRTLVSFDKIPPVVVDAFIAAEDNNFMQHAGVDYFGMLRAVLANLRAGHAKEGASTITQQVVKNLLLGSQRTFKRKIQEVILARRLEHALTKQEILTIYLNEIDFGHNTYGVQEAARLYFGKDISAVNVGEAAVLASLPKEPEALYRAIVMQKDPKRAKDRQIYVLNQMVKIGKLSQPDAQKWIDAPIQVVKQPFPEMGSAPEWVELVHKELAAGRSDAEIDALGGTVRTTLDPSLQAIGQRALQAGLRAVDRRHGIGRPSRQVKPDKVDAEIAKLAGKLPKDGPATRTVYEAVVTGVREEAQQLELDLGKWPATLALGGADDERYNPADDDGKTKTPGARFKRGDVVQVVLAPAPAAAGKSNKQEAPHVVFAPGPEGAIVILDVHSRKVRALVGGYASRAGGFDRATMAHRQAGSSFKPIVYATAFDQAATSQCHANDPNLATFCGTPATVINDAPEAIDKWRPKNFESGEFLGPVRLRTALAKSINTVSIRLAGETKPENIVAMAHKLGVKSELPTTISLALGAGEVTPLELTNALATLADGGIALPPKFIDAIDGKATAEAQGDPAIKPEVAYVITNTMQSVVTEGTAAKVGQSLKIPIAGKTGTSNDARDTWFIGLTPDYAIGVWVGYDDNRPMPGEQGAKVAAPVYIDIMKAMNPPAKAFPRPPHVVEVTIDRATGLLAPDGAPKDTTMTEVFVEGTQPTEVAPKPGEATEGNSGTREYTD